MGGDGTADKESEKTMQRDTSKCKTAKAEEYMTPDHERALQGGWDAQEWVMREAINAPDWAHFVDRDGTAYSVETLAEEWLQGGGDEFESGARALMLALSPQLTANTIMGAIAERVEAGELRAIVDSPDEWE